MRAFLLFFGVALAAGVPALAQESTPTLQRGEEESSESRLLRLSEILGSLHYVRVLCEPSDGEIWRDRMMEMIRLEKPSVQQRNRMIAQFNAGYASASARFASCTEEARAFAAASAREGEAIAQSLAGSINAE